MREKPRDNVALQEGNKQRKVDGRTTEDVRVKEGEREKKGGSWGDDHGTRKVNVIKEVGEQTPRRGRGGGGEVAG